MFRLCQKPETKSEMLWNRLKKLHGPFSTHHIREIGRQIYFDSADRRVREWVQNATKPGLKKLTEKQCRKLKLWKPNRVFLTWYTITRG